MSGATILVSAQGGLVRVALLEAGILVDYCVINPDQPDLVGDVYEGRVIARAPAMAGLFIDLGGALTGFLPDSAGGKSAREGDALRLLVTRTAQGGKGPRLRAIGAAISAKPGLRQRGSGILGEWRALHPDAPIRVDDYGLLATLRADFPDAAHQTACCADIEDDIDALAEPFCPLPGGAVAQFSPTPALVAIDIDARGATADRGGKNAAQLRLNRGVIPDLTRQIRLRNFGGAILIDFAGMKAGARSLLAPDLIANLARDPLKPRLLGFTALGFAEILRPRVRAPLHEVLIP